jgi:ABC-type glycerol-3-phosphate transport system substrate-binding protein
MTPKLICLLLTFFLAGWARADEMLRPRLDGKIELRLSSVPARGTKARLEIDRFLQLNPDVTVRSVSGMHVENLDESQLFLGMAADTAPDVFDGSLREIQTYYVQRFCYPLNEFYDRDRADVLPVQPNVEGVVYQDGKLIALPYFYKVMALLHRRDLFEKYLGRDYQEPARDWDEWFRWSLKLTRPEIGQYGMSVYGGGWFW